MQDVPSSRTTLRFSDFEVDLRAGELRKHGMKVKLQEQPFQVLKLLLEHPGEIVTREDLQRRIWPTDTFVDFDHGVYNAVKRLREALGDSAETPSFIETLSRRGYRFIGRVELIGNNSNHPPTTPVGNAASSASLSSNANSNEPHVAEFASRRSGRFKEMWSLFNRRPVWVRVGTVLCALGLVVGVAVLIDALRSGAHKDEVRTLSVQMATHDPDVQQNGTVKAASPLQLSDDGALEVTKVSPSHNGEFDVMVRNLTDTDLIIHRIAIKKLEESRGIIAGILYPGAKYDLPVDDIPVGGSKRLNISFVVPARGADRFLIALHTTNIYLLEVTLYYNKGHKVSFTKESWGDTDAD
jgi:DNA-binding winged helix-turn-helix (wHTH) protein